MYKCNCVNFRYMSTYKKLRSWYCGLVSPRPKNPPYQHIIQVGDPVLRSKSVNVPKDLLNSQEMQFLIRRMKQVFKKYECVGLSASQIGAAFRVFIIEFNKNHAKLYSPEEFKNKEMSLLPMTVIVNPEIKITDYTKIVFPEACESVRGFYADVPRFRSLNLKALDEFGEPIDQNAVGWTARIIQHEMDHLDGQVYTDIMIRKSLTCSCWNVINDRGGKVELPYGAD